MKAKSNSIVIWLIIVGTLLLRPCMLGERYNTIGIAILCMASLLQIKKEKRILREAAEICLLIIVYWIYILCQSVLLADRNATINLTINSTFSNIIVACTFAVVFSDVHIKKEYLRIVLYAFSILAYSYLVTFGITMLLNKWDSLYLFQIKYGGGSYSGVGKVYFPFSVTYNYYMVFGRTIKRFLSVFRECGILPIFYSFGFFVAPSLIENKKVKTRVQIGLFLGIIFSFSFGGYLAFAVSALCGIDLIKRNRKKSMILIIGMIIGFLIMRSISDMSFAGKLMSGSLTDRTSSMILTLERLSANPLFGSGYANNAGDWLTSINFIGTSGKIGIVGVVLFFWPYFYAFSHAKDKKLFVSSTASLIIILLFAQPIASQNLTVIFWFMFMNYKKEEFENDNKRIKEYSTA